MDKKIKKPRGNQPRSVRQANFIRNSRAIHKDANGNPLFDYSGVEYVSADAKVEIGCLRCGSRFMQTPTGNLRGYGCAVCARNTFLEKKKTTDEFIQQATEAHTNASGYIQYDYSCTNYDGVNKNLNIKCRKCGKEFTQLPGVHLNGGGCKLCKANERRHTKEQFVTAASAIHCNTNGEALYDYSKTEYASNKKPVVVTCKRCGNDFSVIAGEHKRGAGCPICWVNPAAHTTEWFICEAVKVHGDKYSYSNTKYKSLKTKVKIKCNTCKSVFAQVPTNHLKGHGCDKCAKLSITLSQGEFIRRSIETHSRDGAQEYDYSLVEYVSTKVKVQLVCLKCNQSFWQNPNGHMHGHGCPHCYSNHPLTLEQAQARVDSEHGGNVVIIKYAGNTRYNSKLQCQTCSREWEARVGDVVHQGNGCPQCCESQGERRVRIWLESNGFEYEPEKRFDTCRNINTLPFDFLVTHEGVLIEYDGGLHFKAEEIFGGEEALAETQLRDAIKTKWAADNGYHLIRIPYWEKDNIPAILEKELLQKSDLHFNTSFDTLTNEEQS